MANQNQLQRFGVILIWNICVAFALSSGTTKKIQITKNNCSDTGSETSTGNRSDPSDPKSKTLLDFSAHPNFHLLPALDECGVYMSGKSVNHPSTPQNRSRKKRVVGGSQTEFGDHPWGAQIILRNLTSGNIRPNCGATIISNLTILTAAHCVTDVPDGESISHVAIGVYANIGWHEKVALTPLTSLPLFVCSDTFLDTGTEICSTVHLAEIEDVIVHEKYSSGGVGGDMALVRLKRDILHFNTSKLMISTNDDAQPVVVEKQIRPMCLPRRADLLTCLNNKKFEFAGWGRVGVTPEVIEAKYLNRITLSLVPLDYCREITTDLLVHDKQLCMLGAPGSGICSGDSGSPLLKRFQVPELGGREQVFQVGVASQSPYITFGCGMQGIPSVFTNVVEYMPWILDNLQE